MNTSNQKCEPSCVIQPSGDSSREKERLSALRDRLASFRGVLWLAGIIFLFCGAPLVRADFLSNNFWVNSTFELGSDLDQTGGSVSNWNRGGNDPAICQVIRTEAGRAGKALAVMDAKCRPEGSGEWYSDVLL